MDSISKMSERVSDLSKVTIDDTCELWFKCINTLLPGRIMNVGPGYCRVEISVHAEIKFIALVHFADTTDSTPRQCVRRVCQSEYEARVSNLDSDGTRVLSIGDYCSVFNNADKEWMQGHVIQQDSCVLTVELFTGNLKPYEGGDEVSKIFIRRSNSGFTKSSAKHRFLWIASMEGLESFPQEALQDSLSSFSVEHCGVWALVVGKGRDMFFVQPRVHQSPAFPDGDDQSRRIVLLQGPDSRASGMLFMDELPSIQWIYLALDAEVFGGP